MFDINDVSRDVFFFTEPSYISNIWTGKDVTQSHGGSFVRFTSFEHTYTQSVMFITSLTSLVMILGHLTYKTQVLYGIQILQRT
jgi:hypothetical protein